MAKVNIILIIGYLSQTIFQLNRVILKKIVTRIGQIMADLESRNFGGWLDGSNTGSDGLPECVLSASTPYSWRGFGFNFLFRYLNTFWRFSRLFSSYRYGKHEKNSHS